MRSQKRAQPIAVQGEHVKVRRKLKLSDTMLNVPRWCEWEMVPPQIWNGIYVFLMPSAVSNLVCACHLFASDAVLASKVFVLCSDAALKVFDYVTGDMRDNVAEYICCGEKRMCWTHGSVTFDKWCMISEEYRRSMEDIFVMSDIPSSFHSNVVIDQWNDMNTCREAKYDEEQLGMSHHFVSIRLEAYVPVGFAIIVPRICAHTWKDRAAMWETHVNHHRASEASWIKQLPVNQLSAADMAHVAVCLARAGFSDQSHDVRRELFKRKLTDHDDLYELGLKYAWGFDVKKDLVFAEELLRFVFKSGYIDAACALGYVLAALGIMDGARACWEVGVCNKCIASLHNLCVFYRNQGEIDKAKQLLTDASWTGYKEWILESEALNGRGEDYILNKWTPPMYRS